MATLKDQVAENSKAIKEILENAKSIDGLPLFSGNINLEDKLALYRKETGQTVKTSIAELIDSGVGTSIIYETVPLGFSTDKATKGDIHNIFGGLNLLASGQVLSVGSDIVSNNGRSKILIVAKAGTDFNGTLTLTGTKIDRDTSIETPGFSEDIVLDELSVDANGNDSLGNNKYDLTKCYMTSNWYADGFTISTLDLDLSDVDIYSVAFEQFNDVNEVIVDTIDMTCEVSNALAEFSGHAYGVETVNGKTSIVSFADMEIPTTDINAGLYRMRKSNLAKTLNTTTDGLFLDVNFMPFNQSYFDSITLNVWVRIPKTVQIIVDGSLALDNITYGEDLQPGTLVYLKSDGKYWKADNSSEATSTTQLRLIIEAGLADDEKLALKQGQYTTSGLTFGNEYVGINGAVTSSRPTGENDVFRIVSSAINSTTRYFDPSKTWLNGTMTKINGELIAGAGNEFLDSVFKILNSANQTKKLSIDLSSLSANQEISAQFQAKSGIVAYLDDIANANQDYPDEYILVERIAPLQYKVEIKDYKINDVHYPDLQTDTEQLNNGDSTHPRVDLIYINNNEPPEILTREGVADGSVFPPNFDPQTERPIKWIFVDVNATEGEDANGKPIGVDFIYDDASVSPWTVSSPSAEITVGNTDAPISGTHDIKFEGTDSSDVLYGSSSQDISLADVDDFIMDVTVNAQQQWFFIYLLSSETNKVAGRVWFKTGKYGLDKSITTKQTIKIPLSEFNISTSTINGFRLFTSQYNGNLRIDNIRLGKGGVIWVDPNSHTHNNKTVLDQITQTMIDLWNGLVEYSRLGQTLIGIKTLSSGENDIDFLNYDVHKKVLDANTVITFSNLTLHKPQTLDITGVFTLTLPAEIPIAKYENYDGTKRNLIYINPIDLTPGAELYDVEHKIVE